MTLVIQIANKNVKNLLVKYGKIVYESKILDLVYLEVSDIAVIEVIKQLPGILSVEEEGIGYLMTV